MINEIKNSGIVAIIRGQQQENILPIIHALKAGGIQTVEITADTRKINEIIENAVKEFGKDMFIGAGTVLDPETAKSVIQSGAHFIVSPSTNIETIRLTKRYGIVSMPAAMTPTEVITAFESGADIVKLFPASSLGVDYIKNIKGPLSHIPLMATGGVNLKNMRSFFDAGTSLVGIGSSLVDNKAEMSKEDLNQLTQKAREYVEEFKSTKRT